MRPITAAVRYSPSSTAPALARTAGLVDVRIVAAGVYPPYTQAGHERLVWKYRSLVRALDGTPVADALGFFYMLTGTRNDSQ